MILESFPASSEIIVNADGSIYHLGLRPEHLCPLVLAVGDPERVPLVSRYFDRVDEKISKREFVSHIGTLQGKRVMVISSGIGTDNVEILLTELHILANFDLGTLQPLSDHRALQIIRIGTSGALQADVPVDSLLVSDYAFGMDTLMEFYSIEQDSRLLDFAEELMEDCTLDFLPYCEQADADLISMFAQDMLVGNTITAPGFYAPQGRQISLPIRPTGLMDKLQDFQFDGGRIDNFEMETAAYYILGKALGHRVLSTNAIMANRANKQFSRQADKTMDLLIRKVLDKVTGLDNIQP